MIEKSNKLYQCKTVDGHIFYKYENYNGSIVSYAVSRDKFREGMACTYGEMSAQDVRNARSILKPIITDTLFKFVPT